MVAICYSTAFYLTDRICSADKLQVASYGNLSDGRQISCSLFSSTLLLSFEPQMAPDLPKKEHLFKPSDCEYSSSSLTTPFFFTKMIPTKVAVSFWNSRRVTLGIIAL